MSQYFNIDKECGWCMDKPLRTGERKKQLDNKYKYKQVWQYTLDGQLVTSYDTVPDAAAAVNGNREQIYLAANGGNAKKKRDSAYGYIWRYEPIENTEDKQ